MLSLEAIGFTPELLNLCGIFALVMFVFTLSWLAFTVIRSGRL